MLGTGYPSKKSIERFLKKKASRFEEAFVNPKPKNINSKRVRHILYAIDPACSF